MKHFNWLVAALLYRHKDERVHNGDARLEGLRCIDVKYQDQTHLNLCPEACENMIKHYHHERISALDENPRGILEGKEKLDGFVDETVSHFDELKAAFDKFGPLMIVLPIRTDEHGITMIGYSKEYIIYHDSLTGPNRIISFAQLNDLYGGKDIRISHHPLEMLHNISLQLNDNPADLIPNEYKKYSRFFTIRKMVAPTKAVLDLLNDYAGHLAENPDQQHQRQLVRKFIDGNVETPLHELLQAINNELVQLVGKSDAELSKEIAAINYFCPN